jgi:predicted nucleic acid-binding protein
MLVVDASVAVKFVTQEPGSDEAYRIIVGPEPLIAPDWLLVEAASAMWDKVRRSVLLQAHAERNLELLPNFFARLFPAVELLERAYAMAFRLRHPIYDCLYLALAEQEKAALVTADAKFFKAIERDGRYGGAQLLEWPESPT